MKNKRTIKGYSMVEVLIAVSILLLAIAGPMTIAQKGLQSSYFARDQLTAFALAQESIEIFTALRNEAYLEQVNEYYKSGTLDLSKTTLWGWTNDSELAPCFTSDGCNYDFQDETPFDSVVSCSSIDNCLLDYDANGDRSRFVTHGSVPGASESPYTRVVKIEQIEHGSGDFETELRVEVTVSWEPTIFGSGKKEVVLISSIFNYYATP